MSELYGFKKNLEKVQVRSKAESAAKSHIVPTLISNTPLAAPATRYDFADRTIPELANWNVVVLYCKCGNANHNIICFRGVNTQNYLIDALTSTVTRGGYYVDWANNRIRVRWVDGRQDLVQSFVQILAVYGLVQNVDVVDQDTEDEGGDEGEDIDITGLTEEVLGIRIGADGTIYDTAGEAVREQYNKLAEMIDALDIGDSIQQINDAVNTALEQIETAGGLILDPTLTQSGQAADAYATGNAISTVDNKISNTFDIVQSPNVFNGNLTTGFMNLTGVINASSDYSYTDKIPVTATTFVVTADSVVNGRRLNVPLRFLTAFDENQNVLSSYGQQHVNSDNSYIDTTGVTVITLDPSVKYVVLSIYKPTTKYTNVCVSFDTTITEYQEYGTTYTLKSNCLPDVISHILDGNLSGKTIAVFGDSIMYGAGSDGVGPVDILATKYGMTLEKYCVSGATMGVRTDSPSYTVDEVHHIAAQVRNAISDAITPDIIVFNGGTNDIGGNITIGEMTQVYTEPTSESYFADGFETVAYLLKTNFVGSTIIYMRAHNMSSRTYSGQVSYGELGNSIAEKWGISTVDMYKRMNTQLDVDRTAYLVDYTHPNEAGYEKFYIPALEEFLFNQFI